MMTVYIIDYDDKIGDDSDDNFLFFSELETSDNDGRRNLTNLMDMPLTMVRAYKHHIIILNVIIIIISILQIIKITILSVKQQTASYAGGGAFQQRERL